MLQCYRTKMSRQMQSNAKLAYDSKQSPISLINPGNPF